MKKILITGGAGYVGAHTAKMLKQKGYEPIVFDNLVYGHKYAVKWGDFIEGDLNNFDDINNALQTIKPDGIVHCAAYTYVGESVEQPSKYYQNNVVGSLNLFKAMVENKINNLVFSSTCATFGNIEKLPILETTPQKPISPYGTSKLITEFSNLSENGVIWSVYLIKSKESEEYQALACITSWRKLLSSSSRNTAFLHWKVKRHGALSLA